MGDEKKTGLDLLREPFPDHQVSYLPKPTCDKEEYKLLQKGKCDVCGGFHATSKTIHLAYVGHAALTDRLLDADPNWKWEPFAVDESGLPRFDKNGGLWIRLTVCGRTIIGYGNAKLNQYSEIGSREKEVIGDALRNAAMRMGAALPLWHKGELHVEEPMLITKDQVDEIKGMLPAADMTEKVFLAKAGFDSIGSISADQFQFVVNRLRATIKKIEEERNDNQ